LAFARSAVRAVKDLHEAGAGREPMVHRNLTPKTILVKHDNSPILTGFDRAKIPLEISVATSGVPSSDSDGVVALEVRIQGLGAADECLSYPLSPGKCAGDAGCAT